LKLVQSGKIGADQGTLDTLEQDLLELDRLKNVFHNLDFGLSEISKDYFQDKYLLIYWQKAINILKQFLNAKDGWKKADGVTVDSGPHESLMNEARTYSRIGEQLPQIISSAEGMGLLDGGMMSGIGERMMKIDDMSRYLHYEQGDPKPHTNWSVLILPATYNSIILVLTN